MKKKKNITLVCSECYSRNYHVKRNEGNTTQVLEIKKFCPKCNKHILHKGNR